MNILGQPFSPWVTEQIKIRQSSLGNSNNLTNTNLLYQNTKTPWLRLASSVDIVSVDGVVTNLDKILKNTTINELALQGSTPAKNFILQGGASRLIGEEGLESVGFNAGLNASKNGEEEDLITPVYSGAYGWGGIEERGYAPMPGLIGAKVEYYKNGALSKATINMKCFTRNQLALMDVLYMRPGYNLLLEFGWSQYLDNQGALQTFDNFLTPALSYILEPFPQPIDSSNPEKVSSSTTHFDILDLIQKERINRYGNYEGVFGKITNYDWKFNMDGSYDCSVNLIGMGDMMESLKVNIKLPNKVDKLGTESSNNSTSPSENPLPPLISNKNETSLNAILYELYEQLKSSPSNSGTQLDTYQEISIPLFPRVTSTISSDGDLKTNFDNTYDLDIEMGLLGLFGVTTDDEENSSPQAYITFGSLLAIIQKYLLIYNKEGCPLFSFDVDFDNMGEDKNYILQIPGRFSSNPLVCLVPYGGINSGIIPAELNRGGLTNVTVVNNVLKQTKERFIPKGEQFIARLCNIYLNINNIANILNTSERDEEGSLSLLLFLNNIIKSFTKALGGINQITIKVDELTQQIKFIENAPQRFLKPPPTGEYARINTFGVKSNTEGSFVRNIDMKGSISSDFASMITIGAQHNGNTVSSNATGFSTYNAGLIDRVIPEKLNAKNFTTDEEQPTPLTSAIVDLWDNQINNFQTSEGEYQRGLFSSIYQDKKFLTTDCNALTQLNYNFLSLISGVLVEQKHLQSPTFLPFNLSLDIDGLSGMRLYEKFLIDNAVLPPSYGKDDVDLLIKTLNHTVSAGDWLTQIDTQSTPRREMDPNSRPAPNKKEKKKPVDSNDYNEVGGKASPLIPEKNELLRIRLTRIMDDGTQTLGIMEVLDVNEQTVLFTLATSELPWKGNQNSISSVPTGKYRVKPHKSPKHGRCFWLIGNEAGGYKWNKLRGNGFTRSAVLIHKAPKAAGWLEGCIAPGLKFNDQNNQRGRQQGTGQRYLDPANLQSQLAVNKILDKLYSAGSFKMDIINQGGGAPASLPTSFTTSVRNLAINNNLLPNPYTPT